MDAGNNRIQRFAPGSLIADTIAAMTFNNPRGMRLDSIGNLYIADQSNHRVIFYRCGNIQFTYLSFSFHFISF